MASWTRSNLATSKVGSLIGTPGFVGPEKLGVKPVVFFKNTPNVKWWSIYSFRCCSKCLQPSMEDFVGIISFLWNGHWQECVPAWWNKRPVYAIHFWTQLVNLRFWLLHRSTINIHCWLSEKPRNLKNMHVYIYTYIYIYGIQYTLHQNRWHKNRQSTKSQSINPPWCVAFVYLCCHQLRPRIFLSHTLGHAKAGRRFYRYLCKVAVTLPWYVGSWVPWPDKDIDRERQRGHWSCCLMFFG